MSHTLVVRVTLWASVCGDSRVSRVRFRVCARRCLCVVISRLVNSAQPAALGPVCVQLEQVVVHVSAPCERLSRGRRRVGEDVFDGEAVHGRQLACTRARGE
eukprot:6148386-Prymnesium_polylepis.1